MAALPRASRQRGTKPSGARSITRVYATTHTPARTFTFTPAAARSPSTPPLLPLNPNDPHDHHLYRYHHLRGCFNPSLLACRHQTRRPPCALHFTHAYTRTRAASERPFAHEYAHRCSVESGGRTNAEMRPQGTGTCNCVNGTMADGPSLESPAVETRF